MPLTKVGKWAVIYGVVAVEVAVLTGSYIEWNKLNNSQDYRKWMRDHHPKALDVFYWSCGLAGVRDARERDLRDWKKS